MTAKQYIHLIAKEPPDAKGDNFPRFAEMLISVKSYATLRGYQPEDGVLEVEEGASVNTVLQKLGLPPEEAKVVFVNGKHASLDQVLQEGDKIALFPSVGGG
ncbi:MAG: MoaD/ThiS family protein [Desulfohalobiaceae bacterium]